MPQAESVIEKIQPYAKRSLRLSITSGVTRSYFGGHPPFPSGLAWPEKDGRPLAFLGCLALSEISETDVIPWLPKSGNLLFFYDIQAQPWGFDPKDRGSWAALLADERAPERIGAADILPRTYLKFEAFNSLPGWERFGDLGITMDDSEIDAYIDVRYDSIGDGELHQIGGYPRNVQGDSMELECQLASNGIYVGDASGYNSEDGHRLATGASDWRLLLQHEGDEDNGLMWGDCGTIFFWIREQDARNGDFSNVWLVLQCS